MSTSPAPANKPAMNYIGQLMAAEQMMPDLEAYAQELINAGLIIQVDR